MPGSGTNPKSRMKKLLRAGYCTIKKHAFYALSLCVMAAISFPSCTPTKNSYYFKTLPKDTRIDNTLNKVTESKIRKGDLLTINISSLNPAEDAVYNAAASSAVSGSLSLASGSGYTVDINGNIQFHRLGIIHAEGMTRRELKEKVQKDLSPYLKDPIVTVHYANHRVTILGEVNKPQVLQMPEEQMTLLEVLGNSGDLNSIGRRDNILIIRETGNGKQFKRINLEDQSIFTSEWYYLQPDDVVYVEPSDKKIKDEKRARIQQDISVALSGISLILIILSRIFP